MGGYEDGQRSRGYEDGQRSVGYEDGQRSVGYEDGQRSVGYEDGERSGEILHVGPDEPSAPPSEHKMFLFFLVKLQL